MSKKLYMYRLLSDHIKEEYLMYVGGFYFSDKWNLVGLDRHYWKDANIRDFFKDGNIRPFEVRQNNFDLLLSTAPLLDIKIIKVDFTDELLEEEHEELIQILRSESYDDLNEFVENQRFEFERDIEQITFRFNNIKSYHNITFSRDGVLVIDTTDENKLPNVISTEPIGLLSGVYLPNDSERLH
ncbi:hypothetical protein [Paenibacillus sp. VMFN-D1]|uniref:hypothetical protein n=1 Tax=Paenibacillus sp. VMFN-D1 TaxID=2135608 RepID=UPI000E26F717|nr:hypothetical protein [Paenibacillus sp. VMFN-D1]RED34658.1 hypothetical protein C7820_4321 [Paenibacillus sp. VMFN-D1]